ncbi:MAG: 2-isopropylmalate synthase [Chloroflexi bacterium]|nr:2-isopropylmalate synthase [Chloroflexota bacterium]
MADTITIFDTTLRDGEQAAGAGLSWDEKLEIARQLERLGVDVIEAGFPASSPGNLATVQRIAQEIRQPIIAGLARCVPGDIDAAWEAVRGAARPRIHVFISSSDIHLTHQLRKTPEEVLDQAIQAVERAKSYCDDVEFSPMDATRTDWGFIYRLLNAVIGAGATTVNIPDTVGYAIPSEFGRLIGSVFERVSNIDRAVVSVHCHNDLGLASANSLAAIEAGARQVEVCVNGIGERAGNASLEEVVMAIRTREDLFKFRTNVDTTQIYRTSRMVSDYTGFTVQPNKAIVGANAFRHESGIHQDAMLKAPITFEIMRPESVGLPGSSLVLGRQSGRHALQARLSDLGFDLSADELIRVYAAFKELADKKDSVTDRDLEALTGQDRRTTGSENYVLEHVQAFSGSTAVPTATVRITDPKGQTHVASAIGTGPVDAVYQAISQVVGVANKLVEYRVEAVTEGLDAMADVTLRIERDGTTFVGRGADTDIVVASSKAYIDALNRLISSQNRATSIMTGHH